MNADRVISKINIEMNAFNESGSREDKACAEGLRMARTYVQQEVLKSKILTHDQQVVLEWLKATQRKENYPMGAITYIQDLKDSPYLYAFENLSIEQEFQVLSAFAEWGLSNA